MPLKYHLQLGLDLLLTALFLSLMGFFLWGEEWHEWLGVVALVVVALHLGLDFWWFKKLNKGEYTAYRLLQTSINALLLLAFLTATVSGLMLSQYVLPESIISSSSDFTRKTHLASVYWLQIIISVHLGLHWKMLTNYFAKNCPKLTACKPLFTLLWLTISAYGAWVFIDHHIVDYLFLKVEFAFFDMAQSKWLFYWDFFAITILVAYATRILVWVGLFRKSG